MKLLSFQNDNRTDRVTIKIANFIDHLCVSRRSITSECEMIHFHFSDHSAVFRTLMNVEVSLAKKISRFTSFRSFRLLKNVILLNDLFVPWSILDSFDDLNDTVLVRGCVMYCINTRLLKTCCTCHIIT